jgi:plastocyanin
MLVAGCGGKGGGVSNGGAPADVVVHGNDALKFDEETYTATADTVTIELVDDGTVPHTLLIDKVKEWEKLSVTRKGDTDKGSVQLAPGTYTIYCDVPGHRAAGMEAKLVVN